MSDGLVKRLRDTPNWMREGRQPWKDNVKTYDRAPFEAADRIEDLEAENAALLERWGILIKAIDECVIDADLYDEILTEAGYNVKTTEGDDT